jgi:4-hydroxybenzoate polyprenyltransferase
MDKPIGSLLLLWPTLNALWIASDGRPRWPLVAIFALGTLLMRSAGCAINDYADRDFDRHVKRTAERPLTSGKIRAWEAVAIAAVLSFVAFLLILPLNTLTKELSVVALFVAGSYPFMKRFFAIPQAYLGIAFGFGIPMAFAACRAGAGARVGDAARERVLVGGLRHRICDGRPRRRPQDRHQDVGATFGRFDVAAIMLCYAVTLGIYAWIGATLGFGSRSGRLGRGARLRAVSLHADQGPRADAVLRRVPAQQLARRRAVRRDRRALSGGRCGR